MKFQFSYYYIFRFLTGNQIVDTIHATLDDYGSDYTHLLPENFSLLINDIMNQVAIMYINSVLQRSVSFCSSSLELD